VECLTATEVLVLHARLIQQTGGSGGVLRMGCLEAAVARPRVTVVGEELYADVWRKVAALMHSLLNNHAFVDGNKRVARTARVRTRGGHLSRAERVVTERRQQRGCRLRAARAPERYGGRRHGPVVAPALRELLASRFQAGERYPILGLWAGGAARNSWRCYNKPAWLGITDGDSRSAS